MPLTVLAAEQAPLVGASEFASIMAPLGPFGAERRIALAVSGGGDSMALALLAAGWGRPLALIVDHGLRPDSGAEAALTAERLASRGIPARILRLAGLPQGPGLPARARQARYAALAAACREAGLVHLLLGHQQGDQAETRLMRQACGSGPAGLAAMAAVVERAGVRLVRPLLGIAPARLRATLLAAGLAWVEDPTNQDRRFLRPRLRQAIGGGQAELARAAARAGAERRREEMRIAAILAERADFHPEGFVRLSPGPIAPAALAAVIRAVTGAAYPPPPAATAALAAAPRAATLAGARLVAVGRGGPGWFVLREAAAMAGPMPARDGAMWDGRFRLRAASGLPEGAVIGALGADAARWRRQAPWPAAVLATLPALRHGETLLAVPHIVDCDGLRFLPAAAHPAAGAPFLAIEQDTGRAGDAKEQEAPYVVEWRRTGQSGSAR